MPPGIRQLGIRGERFELASIFTAVGSAQMPSGAQSTSVWHQRGTAVTSRKDVLWPYTTGHAGEGKTNLKGKFRRLNSTVIQFSLARPITPLVG